MHIIRLRNFVVKFRLMKTKALEICSKTLVWRQRHENYVYPCEISILNPSVLQFCITTAFDCSKILSLWPSRIKIYFFAEQARSNINPVKLLKDHGFFLQHPVRFIILGQKNNNKKKGYKRICALHFKSGRLMWGEMLDAS